MALGVRNLEFPTLIIQVSTLDEKRKAAQPPHHQERSETALQPSWGWTGDLATLILYSGQSVIVVHMYRLSNLKELPK